MQKGNEILVAYKAQSGFVSKLFDVGHKIISPNTYNCELCKLSHGNFRIHSSFKNALEKTLLPVTFIYTNQLKDHELNNTPTPFIAIKQNGKWSIVIDHNTIGQLNNTEELIKTLDQSLSKFSPI